MASGYFLFLGPKRNVLLFFISFLFCYWCDSARVHYCVEEISVPSDPYVLGLLDPDPLVRGMDPDPDPSIIKQK